MRVFEKKDLQKIRLFAKKLPISRHPIQSESVDILSDDDIQRDISQNWYDGHGSSHLSLDAQRAIWRSTIELQLPISVLNNRLQWAGWCRCMEHVCRDSVCERHPIRHSDGFVFHWCDDGDLPYFLARVGDWLAVQAHLPSELIAIMQTLEELALFAEVKAISEYDDLGAIKYLLELHEKRDYPPTFVAEEIWDLLAKHGDYPQDEASQKLLTGLLSLVTRDDKAWEEYYRVVRRNNQK